MLYKKYTFAFCLVLIVAGVSAAERRYSPPIVANASSEGVPNAPGEPGRLLATLPTTRYLPTGLKRQVDEFNKTHSAVDESFYKDPSSKYYQFPTYWCKIHTGLVAYNKSYTETVKHYPERKNIMLLLHALDDCVRMALRTTLVGVGLTGVGLGIFSNDWRVRRAGFGAAVVSVLSLRSIKPSNWDRTCDLFGHVFNLTGSTNATFLENRKFAEIQEEHIEDWLAINQPVRDKHLWEKLNVDNHDDAA